MKDFELNPIDTIVIDVTGFERISYNRDDFCSYEGKCPIIEYFDKNKICLDVSLIEGCIKMCKYFRKLDIPNIIKIKEDK